MPAEPSGRRSKNDPLFAAMRKLVNEESMSRAAAARRVAESHGGSAASLNAGYSRYLERAGHDTIVAHDRGRRAATPGGDAASQFEDHRRAMEAALLSQWHLTERVKTEAETEIARLQATIAGQADDRERLVAVARVLGVELPA
jgi:hypothetical protein